VNASIKTVYAICGHCPHPFTGNGTMAQLKNKDQRRYKKMAEFNPWGDLHGCGEPSSLNSIKHTVRTNAALPFQIVLR
jgi:hypothetical protein